MAGVLKLGNTSLDGTKIHADASKRKAVSYTQLLALEAHVCVEVEELFALRERVDQGALPDGLVVSDAIAIRQARLAGLAEARAVLLARAKERDASEQAEYATETASARRQSPADRPHAAPSPAHAAHARPTRQGPIQLH